jgi:hypothetical protein
LEDRSRGSPVNVSYEATPSPRGPNPKGPIDSHLFFESFDPSPGCVTLAARTAKGPFRLKRAMTGAELTSSKREMGGTIYRVLREGSQNSSIRHGVRKLCNRMEEPDASARI